MGEATPSKRTSHGTEKVREHLLTSLHLGRLKPGDRVMSVRRLAGLTGMNRKTIHRAYQVLEHEGFLLVRPGAGTYVATDPSAIRSQDELIRSVNRCRGEAHALGLSPSAYADFVHSALNGGLAGLPLAVVECNLEQIEMISRDLREGLGVDPRPVLLSDLVANPVAAVRGTWSVVTTDCHRAEVDAAVRSVGISVHRVALDAEFPHTVLRWAKARGAVIVVRDERFAGVFLRFLGQLGATEATLARIRIVPSQRIAGALRDLGEKAVVLVSPLVEREADTRVPPGARRASAHWRMAEGTLDGLRASLAFEIASRRKGHA
jgi:DNA-binding transcriptional regulator YhcF (GntR family)